MDPAAWRALVAAAGGRCKYCGELRQLTMDHRIPLSRGGRHEIENITPACKPCNSRKHTRTEEEFRALLRREREGGVSEDDTPYVASGRGVPSDIDVGEQDIAVRRLDVHAA